MNVVGYIISYESNAGAASFQKKIQAQKIESFCKQNRLKLLDNFVEPDNCNPEYRPRLVTLMNIAPQKKFSGIVVYSFSKLADEEEIRKWIIDELKKHDVTVYSATETTQIEEAPPPKEQPDEKFKSIKHKIRDLPSLPEVVTKITELVQNPNSSAAQLSKIISQDSGLTSRVLRLVNSAYYGFPKQISSIQHAIMILGFTTIRGLVLSSSIFKMFSSKGGTTGLDYKKFWKHSLLTAIASKRIYQKLFFEDDDNIFSAAILHDIGKLILDQYDHDGYVNVISEMRHQISPEKLILAERKHCGVSHPVIGSMIAESWNLPGILTDVIKYHHSPLESKQNEKITTVVYIGNIISRLVLDFGVFDPKVFDEKVLSKLGVDVDDIGVIFSDIREEAGLLDDLESFFK